MTDDYTVEAERDVQNKVIDLLHNVHKYRYIGNLKEQENKNLRRDDVLEFLTNKQHCTKKQAEEALRKLQADTVCADIAHLYDANKAVYHDLRYPIQVHQENSELSRQLSFINWAEPEKNDFGIAEEVTVRRNIEDVKHRRPDLVVYVNGIALCVLELKKDSVSVADAIRSVLSQKAAFPFNVIVVDNHSTDGTTEQIRQFRDDRRVVHLIPERTDLGIGGCWDYAVCSPQCGRFAVQLDSDDLYSGPDTLQRIVDAFHRQRAAMVIGSYKLVDFQLNTLPPGIIDHREWTDDNGRNNALRINGLGAPRAFFTPLLRRLGFPNTSYGEDYALGLRISRQWRIGRIYDVLYLCRRWEGNSDAALSIEKQNKNNLYKDRLRTLELRARRQMVGRWNRKPDAAEVDRFFERQLAAWPEVRRRFEELTTAVETRTLACGDVSLEAQFNPARIRSTGAKVDKATISKRPCFLCEHNQPAEQIHLSLLGDFQLCVNPFPILPKHFTLPTRRHLPQQAAPQFRALCELAASLPDLVVFYNGAQCGASAPDHAHLQLGAKGQIPLQRDWKRYAAALEPVVVSSASEGIYVLHTFVYPLFVMKLKTGSPDESLFHRLTSALPVVEGEDEPRFNLIGWREGDHLVVTLIPRCKLRPQCYFEEGSAQMLISPGAVDMGGLLITPRREDFDRLTPQQATAILREVTLTEEEVKGCVDRI